MKAKFKKNENNDNLLNFLNQNEEFNIVGIYIDMSTKSITYRVVDRESRPILVKDEDIEITNNYIPSNWVVKRDRETIEMTYLVFQKDEFWEDFFDNVAEVVEVFNNIIKGI